MSNNPQKQPLTPETKQAFYSMGYTSASITQAHKKTNGDPQVMADYLINNCQMNHEQAQIQMAKESSLQVPAAAVGPLGMTKEEMDLQQAMEMSMKEQYSWQMFEPLSIQKRIRQNGVPVGLRNIGNTCYVNSLLQAYFMIPEFVEAVLKF